MCGEKFRVLEMDRTLKGSPPRVRGEDDFHGVCAVRFRITPACAGRRRLSWRLCRPISDHPRVCGEKPSASRRSSYHTGSPPRVRGEATVRCTRRRPHRITPACAGRRIPVRNGTKRTKDHPRVCGEKDWTDIEDDDLPGSPPRVRGEAARCGSTAKSAGITPACAGRSRACPALHFSFGDHPRVCGEKQKAVPATISWRGEG